MMRLMKLGSVAVVLLAIPLLTSAQMRRMPVRSSGHPVRMMRSPMTRAVGPARPTAIRVAPDSPHGETFAASIHPASEASVSPNGATELVSAAAASLDLNQLLNNVPGLGFDYAHLAALNGNLGERAFIDPVTQQDIALAEQLSRNTPAFTGGFIPFWSGFGSYSEPIVEEEQPQEQPQPRVIVLQEPVAASAQAAPSASPSESAAQEQPPLPDVGEFTLVLRNGSKIEAVAFTRQKDQIVYVTSDGVRNSFPVSDLDAAATQRLNRQRGTPLNLSL